MNQDVLEKYGHFVCEALEPYCTIEGSEVGDAQQALLDATRQAIHYRPGAEKVLEGLEQSIRDMLKSDWFLELLAEEKPPYDYWTQGLKDAAEKVEEVRHKHIGSAKRYAQYGGKEAEVLIKEWKAPEVGPAGLEPIGPS